MCRCGVIVGKGTGENKVHLYFEHLMYEPIEVDVNENITDPAYEVANEGGEKVNVVNERVGENVVSGNEEVEKGCEDGSDLREEANDSDLVSDDDSEVGLHSSSSSDDGYESAEDELYKPNPREAEPEDEEDEPTPQKKQKRQGKVQEKK